MPFLTTALAEDFRLDTSHKSSSTVIVIVQTKCKAFFIRKLKYSFSHQTLLVRVEPAMWVKTEKQANIWGT